MSFVKIQECLLPLSSIHSSIYPSIHPSNPSPGPPSIPHRDDDCYSPPPLPFPPSVVLLKVSSALNSFFFCCCCLLKGQTLSARRRTWIVPEAVWVQSCWGTEQMSERRPLDLQWRCDPHMFFNEHPAKCQKMKKSGGRCWVNLN